jgi:hypothetical protein
MPEPPTGYIVDVCAACARLAVWPFCEHRATDRWRTTAVRVTLPVGERNRLRRTMTDA